MRASRTASVDLVPYYAGDWDWDPARDCYRVVYSPIRYGEPVNGLQNPVVSRSVLQAIVARWTADVQGLPASDAGDVDHLEWVGERVRVQRPGEPARRAAETERSV